MRGRRGRGAHLSPQVHQEQLALRSQLPQLLRDECVLVAEGLGDLSRRLGPGLAQELQEELSVAHRDL